MKINIKNLLEIVTILTIVTLVACDKDQFSANCNVENPSEEIVWLKDAIDDLEGDAYSWYGRANYNGETVFYYNNCHPAVNYVSFTFNCSGENIGYTNDLFDKFTEKSVLWKHPESKCNFD